MAVQKANITLVEYSTAFPKKVNYSLYMEVIDAATRAVKGEDGKPKVVLAKYDTPAEAAKAANRIRAYSQTNKLGLRVSYADNSLEVRVYRGEGKVRQSTKKKENGTVDSASTGVPAQ